MHSNAYEHEELSLDEHHLMGLLRLKAMNEAWVDAECGTCGTTCQWPDTATAPMMRPSPEGPVEMAPMCDGCSFVDSQADSDRMRWSSNERRINAACEPLADIADVHVTPLLKRWITSPNKALVLQGESGFGKTTQTKGLIKAVVRTTSQSAAYYTEAGLYQALTRFEAKDDVAKTRTRIQSAGLLVIDDFGTATSSEYRDELLFEIIDHIYRTKRRLIILTNLADEQMWRHCEDRIRRRIMDMCVRPVDIKSVWTDVRRAERPPRAMEL
jgi:hypothetical protein